MNDNYPYAELGKVCRACKEKYGTTVSSDFIDGFDAGYNAAQKPLDRWYTCIHKDAVWRYSNIYKPTFWNLNTRTVSIAIDKEFFDTHIQTSEEQAKDLLSAKGLSIFDKVI